MKHMGFYTKYFSTLFKGVRATAWKERIEARRAIRKLRKGSREWESAARLIQEHRVTASLKKLRQALTDLSGSSSNADKFIFNATTQDRALVMAEQEIL